MAGSESSSDSEMENDDGASQRNTVHDVRGVGDVDRQLSAMRCPDRATPSSPKRQRKPATQYRRPGVTSQDSGGGETSSATSSRCGFVSCIPGQPRMPTAPNPGKRKGRLKVPKSILFGKGDYVTFKNPMPAYAREIGGMFNYCNVVHEGCLDIPTVSGNSMQYVERRTEDKSCVRPREPRFSQNCHASCFCFDRLRRAMKNCREENPDLESADALLEEYFRQLAQLLVILRTADTETKIERAYRYILMNVILQTPATGNPTFYIMSLRFQTQNKSMLEFASFKFCVGFLAELLGCRHPTSFEQAKIHQTVFGLDPDITGLNKGGRAWQHWYIKGTKNLTNGILTGIPSDQDKMRDLMNKEEHTTSTPLERLKMFATKGRSKAVKRASHAKFTATVVGTRQAIFQAMVDEIVTKNLTHPGQKAERDATRLRLRKMFGNLLTNTKFLQDFNMVSGPVFEETVQLEDTISGFAVAHSQLYYPIRRTGGDEASTIRNVDKKYINIVKNASLDRETSHRFSPEKQQAKLNEDNYHQGVDELTVRELHRTGQHMTQQQRDYYDFLEYMDYARTTRQNWQKTKPKKPDAVLFQGMRGAQPQLQSQATMHNYKPGEGASYLGYKGVVLACKGQEAWDDLLHNRDCMAYEVPQVLLKLLDNFAERLYRKFVFDDHGAVCDPKSLTEMKNFRRLNGNDNIFVHKGGPKPLSGWFEEVELCVRNLDTKFNDQIKKTLDLDRKYTVCETIFYLQLNVPDFTKQTVENMRSEYPWTQICSFENHEGCELLLAFFPLDRNGGTRHLWSGTFPWADNHEFDPLNSIDDCIAANGVVVHTPYGQMLVIPATVLTSDGLNYSLGSNMYLVGTVFLRDDGCHLTCPEAVNRADPYSCYYNENGCIDWRDDQKATLKDVMKQNKNTTNLHNKACNLPSVAYISPAGEQNDDQKLLRRFHQTPNMLKYFGPMSYGYAEHIYFDKEKIIASNERDTAHYYAEGGNSSVGGTSHPGDESGNVGGASEGREANGTDGNAMSPAPGKKKRKNPKTLAELVYYDSILTEKDGDSDIDDLPEAACQIANDLAYHQKEADRKVKTPQEIEDKTKARQRKRKERQAVLKANPTPYEWGFYDKNKSPKTCSHCNENIPESPSQVYLTMTHSPDDKPKRIRHFHATEKCFVNNADLTEDAFKAFLMRKWNRKVAMALRAQVVERHGIDDSSP